MNKLLRCLFIMCLAGIIVTWIYIYVTVPGSFFMGTKNGMSLFEWVYLIRHGAGKELLVAGAFSVGAVTCVTIGNHM